MSFLQASLSRCSLELVKFIPGFHKKQTNQITIHHTFENFQPALLFIDVAKIPGSVTVVLLTEWFKFAMSVCSH